MKKKNPYTLITGNVMHINWSKRVSAIPYI